MVGSYAVHDELFPAEYDQLLIERMRDIGHMSLMNSSVLLSKSFIVRFVDNIDWDRLVRSLPEPIVDRYRLRITKWNEQLYGEPRTFEFIVKYADRFDWYKLSKDPPTWFNAVHFEHFAERMNWKELTKRISKLPMSLVSMKADELDWEWISEYHIVDESFAKRFVRLINWSHPRLDVRMLSTEFLYDIYMIRKTCHEFNDDLPIMYISKYKKICVSVKVKMIGDFDPDQKIKIGCSISLKFALEHKDDICWTELIEKNLITDEMVDALANG